MFFRFDALQYTFKNLNELKLYFIDRKCPLLYAMTVQWLKEKKTCCFMQNVAYFINLYSNFKLRVYHF